MRMDSGAINYALHLIPRPTYPPTCGVGCSYPPTCDVGTCRMLPLLVMMECCLLRVVYKMAESLMLNVKC